MNTSPPRRRRADAQRSIDRIVSAARARLSADPNATMDEIVQAAGVGRMTLYGHFPTRKDLVEAALVDAMTRLLESSWSLVAEAASLVTAAQGVLPAGRLRRLHDAPAKRVEELIRRGQDQGVFRTDLPITWLVSAVHYLLHGAVEEIRSGRLARSKAAHVVTESAKSLLMGNASRPRTRK